MNCNNIILSALFVITLSSICEATVDPNNATQFRIRHNRRLEKFNITHYYFREANVRNKWYQLENPNDIKCTKLKSNIPNITFWVNKYELPDSITFINNKEEQIDITDKTEMRKKIENLVRFVFREMAGWDAKAIKKGQYYETLNNLMNFTENNNNRRTFTQSIVNGVKYINGKRVYDDDEKNSVKLWPIMIHFRSLPYPQSTFTEFVSNKDKKWRIYDRSLTKPAKKIYKEEAGLDSDLLYRLRHNLRHSMGLGHTTNKKCIMFPTNVRGNYKLCPEEKKALARLLCA